MGQIEYIYLYFLLRKRKLLEKTVVKRNYYYYYYYSVRVGPKLWELVIVEHFSFSLVAV